MPGAGRTAGAVTGHNFPLIQINPALRSWYIVIYSPVWPTDDDSVFARLKDLDRQSLDARIDAIRARFLAGIEGRLEEARDLMADGPHPTTGETRPQMLHRLVHGLCGNAGLLGFSDMDREGRKALLIVEIAHKQSRFLTEEERSEVGAVFDRVLQHARSASADRAR